MRSLSSVNAKGHAVQVMRASKAAMEEVLRAGRGRRGADYPGWSAAPSGARRMSVSLELLARRRAWPPLRPTTRLATARSSHRSLGSDGNAEHLEARTGQSAGTGDPARTESRRPNPELAAGRRPS